MVWKFGVNSIILGSPTQNVDFTLWHSKKYTSYTHLYNQRKIVCYRFWLLQHYKRLYCQNLWYTNVYISKIKLCLKMFNSFFFPCLQKTSQSSQSQTFAILVRLTWWTSSTVSKLLNLVKLVLFWNVLWYFVRKREKYREKSYQKRRHHCQKIAYFNAVFSKFAMHNMVHNKNCALLQ